MRHYFSANLPKPFLQTYAGVLEIQRHIQRLEAMHLKHMMVYGSGNSMRMSGMFPKFSSPLSFSWAVGTKSTSLRVSEQWSHYEDRRPAANMDPYLVGLEPSAYCALYSTAGPGALNDKA